MTARLQAASTSGRPVLLRLETRAGHGAGKPVRKLVEEYTDIWSFVFAQIGMAPKAPGAATAKKPAAKKPAAKKTAPKKPAATKSRSGS